MSDFVVNLETHNVCRDDGWVFRIVPSFAGDDTWEVVCIAHPTPVTPSIAENAMDFALEAKEAYIRAVAGRH